jgi:hypothetical protein
MINQTDKLSQMLESIFKVKCPFHPKNLKTTVIQIQNGLKKHESLFFVKDNHLMEV